MRAKRVFEVFIEDSDPIKDMGIGQRAIIKKWFETWAPDVKYTIDDNLNVVVHGSLGLYGTNITELPKNLSVEGWVDLRGTKITELPENLSVGSLDLRGTPITELPEGLSVEGYLDLQRTNITELPKSLKVRGAIFKDF